MGQTLAMEVQLRSLAPDEYEDLARMQSNAFGFPYSAESVETYKETIEPERSIGAFDQSALVGTNAAYRFDLTVPGAILPCSGVTLVSVLPTHRRGGIATGMMRFQLDAARDWGEPIAALWASEGGIYGRFGYGSAVKHCSWTLDRVHGGLREDISATGTVRFLSLEETKEIVPPLYDSIREVRPGLISRSETWWRLKSFADPPERRGGGTEAFWVAYEEGGEVLGTARYRRRQRWTDWIPDGKTQVLSVLAKTPAAEAGLWKYLIGIDLVSTIEANERPSDEPLYWMLKDARRLQQRPSDSLWIRLTDVPGALASRRYSAPGSFVVEVVDEFCSWNSGRYRLEGGPAGATCTATSESSNITTSAEVLGAAFLGSSRLATLAAAGLVEGDERSIRLADMMFSWMPRPWCHDFF